MMIDIVYVFMSMMIASVDGTNVSIRTSHVDTDVASSKRFPGTDTVNSLMFGYLSSTPSATRRGLFIGVRDNTASDGIKMFDRGGDLKATCPNPQNIVRQLLKDPMRLLSNPWYDGANKYVFSLQEGSMTYGSSGYACSLLNSASTSSQPVKSGVNDTLGTNYLYLTGDTRLVRYDIITYTETVSAVVTVSLSFYTAMHDIEGTVMIFELTDYIHLLERSTMTVIKTLTYPQSVTRGVHMVDSRDNYISYSLDNNLLLSKYDLASSVTVPLLLLDSNVLTSKGSKNMVLNLGTWEYLVTIPSSNLSAQLIVISKQDLTIVAALNLETGSTPVLWFCLAGLDIVDNALYYIGFIESNSRNFHSYYLLVGNCTLRDSGSNCTQCVANNYLHNNQCLTADNFPEGYGINPLSISISRCEDAGCTKCADDYSKCTECNATVDYMLKNSKCAMKMKLKSVEYRVKIRSIFIKFNESVDSDTDFSSLVFTLDDLAFDKSSNLVLDKDLEIFVTNQGLFIVLGEGVSCTNGLLTIKTQDSSFAIFSSTHQHYFSDFPIKVFDIYSPDKSSSIQTVADASVLSISTISTASMIVTSGSSSPSLSIVLLKVASNLVVLSLIGGPVLKYPEIILETGSKIGVLPLVFKNPFESHTNDSDCKTDDTIYNRGMECNILRNQGQEIVIMYCTLIVNVCIGSIFGMIYSIISNNVKAKTNAVSTRRSKKDSCSAVLKVVRFVQNTFGVKYSLLSLEGVQSELVTYSIINMVYFYGDSLSLTMGLLVSMKIMIYYVTVEVIRLIQAARIWSACREISSNTRLVESIEREYENINKRSKRKQSKKELKEMRLSSVVNIDHLPVSIVSLPYESMKYPRSIVYLLTPCICFTKNVLTVGGLLLLIDHTIIQMAYGLVIESVYLVFMFKYNSRYDNKQYIVDIVVVVCNILFIVLKIVSLIDVSASVKQDIIGLNAAIVLLISIAINTLYIVYSIIISILLFIRSCKHNDDSNDDVNVNDNDIVFDNNNEGNNNGNNDRNNNDEVFGSKKVKLYDIIKDITRKKMVDVNSGQMEVGTSTHNRMRYIHTNMRKRKISYTIDI